MIYAAAIDVDGVICDSSRENYHLLVETWKELTTKDYPFCYDDFMKNVRTIMTHPRDYFSFSKAILAGDEMVDRDATRVKYSGFAEKGYHVYMQHRGELKKRPSEYSKLLPLYPGVRQMFSDLGTVDDLSIYITSQRDQDSINFILDSNRFPLEEIRIFHSGDGNRKKQLEKLFEFDYINSNIVLYDDARENLIFAKQLGVHPIGAPQGYNPEGVAEFRNAMPEEFVGVLKEVLEI